MADARLVACNLQNQRLDFNHIGQDVYRNVPTDDSRHLPHAAWVPGESGKPASLLFNVPQAVREATRKAAF